MRRVVQIAASDMGLMVLCDDGTMWNFNSDVRAWAPAIPVPQGDPMDVARDVAAKRAVPASVEKRSWWRR